MKLKIAYFWCNFPTKYCTLMYTIFLVMLDFQDMMTIKRTFQHQCVRTSWVSPGESLKPFHTQISSLGHLASQPLRGQSSSTNASRVKVLACVILSSSLPSLSSTSSNPASFTTNSPGVRKTKTRMERVRTDNNWSSICE